MLLIKSADKDFATGQVSAVFSSIFFDLLSIEIGTEI
jgi:hypothetical protein